MTASKLGSIVHVSESTVVRFAIEQKGERVALREARKHAGFYFRGLRNAAEKRRRGSLVTTYAELEEIVAEALEEAAGEE